jgi:drug/metabolite transporter (DMT)-like permease
VEPGLLLGLAAAGAFGAGDFAGGFASRRLSPWHVATGAQLVGLAALLVLLPVVRPPAPDPSALALGAVAGACGGIGLAALYAGLSLGSMGLVAALSAVGSVAIPLLVGALVIGEAIGPTQWLGVGAAAAAAGLAARATTRGTNPRAVQLAVVAAVGFGLWFALLDQAAASHELWALIASRAAAAALVGGLTLALARRATARPPRWWWAIVVLTGVLDVTGNGAFVLAALALPVGVAAALSGLYPIVTMLLARVLVRDALPPLALVAVLMAVIGIVLISLG